MAVKRYVVEMDENIAAIFNNSGQIKIVESVKKPMTAFRAMELTKRYLGKASSDVKDLKRAEKTASGFAWTQDDMQPVDDATLSADIDEMREFLGIK